MWLGVLYWLTALVVSGPAAAAGAFERALVADHPLAKGLGERERLALEAIALQPGSLHAMLLSVAAHAELLVQLPATWNDLALADPSNDRFEQLLAGLAPAQRGAFREFVGYPELATLLLENIRVSESLAGAWRVDPSGTRAQLRDLAQRVLAQREKRAEAELRRREAARIAAEREREERARREREFDLHGDRAWDRTCWYGDPRYDYGGYGRGAFDRHCGYPWRGYRDHRW